MDGLDGIKAIVIAMLHEGDCKMDGIVRIMIAADDVPAFRAWLAAVKAIKAVSIDEDVHGGYVSARIMVGQPHRAGRVACYSPAQIVRMHDNDGLSYGAISERLGCSKATAHDAYCNYYRRSRIRLDNRVQELRHAGCTDGWLYTVGGDVPGLADSRDDISDNRTVLGRLSDGVDVLLPAYVAARAAADLS